MGNKSKKILFVTGSLTGGGAERVISILASVCAELGADVSIAILREDKQSYKLSDKVKCYQVKTENNYFKLISRISKLRSIIKTSNCNVIIPFLPIITLCTIAANIGLGKKIIMSERADPNISFFAKNINIKDRIANLLMRQLKMFYLADYMVFQTYDAQQWYGKTLQKKSAIIPNPVDTNALPTIFKGEREKRIIAAGRLAEEKNFAMLIDGFAIFSKTHPEYILEIFGEGSLREVLLNKAEQLGISDRVNLPGFTPNLSEIMHKSTMYISTSNHEGISNSMLEALAMGVPTIATDCPIGGSKMFVKTGETGILIPMNDSTKLADAMIKIADNKEFTIFISNQAYKVREKLDAKDICKKWLEIINNIK